jgi:hypothetical protein
MSENKKTAKIRDLKPNKDAKGGGHAAQGFGAQGHSAQGHAAQGSAANNHKNQGGHSANH